MLFTKYLYLSGSLTAFFISAVVFVLRPDLRKKIIVTGLTFAILGFLLEYFFFQDYWKPPLVFQIHPFGGLEDLLFGFAAGSVGATLYDIFHKTSDKTKYKVNLRLISTTVILELISLLYFTVYLGLNSIYASALGFFAAGTLEMLLKPRLLNRAIFTAIVGALIFIVGESVFIKIYPGYLHQYFLLLNNTYYVGNTLPLTELIWGLGVGFMIGTF